MPTAPQVINCWASSDLPRPPSEEIMPTVPLTKQPLISHGTRGVAPSSHFDGLKPDQPSMVW